MAAAEAAGDRRGGGGKAMMAVFSVAEDGETKVEIALKLPCEDSVCLLHQRGSDGCDISGQQSAHVHKVLKGV